MSFFKSCKLFKIYILTNNMLGLLLSTMIGVPLDYDFNYNQVEQVQQIQHIWFSAEDEKQKMVQRAYELWGLDFVIMIECENGAWNPTARWDSGKAVWLCQMNTRWHKLPQEYYNSWEYQLKYCYKKWSTGTKYYWPDRRIKWVKCKDYVKNRFILNQSKND